MTGDVLHGPELDPETRTEIETGESGLLDGRVRLQQPLAGYRVAIDPVFLAAATPAVSGSEVLDLGCGVGAAALCLLARVPECRITGWDIQPDMVELARQNAALNDCSDRFRVVCRDGLCRDIEQHARFDLVMTNPPYQAAGTSSASPHAGKARAHQEEDGDLWDWLNAAFYCLRPGGYLTLIHRADRLHDLLSGLRERCGDITIHPLWPGRGRPARRVLLRARPGSRAPTRLLPGLELHGPEQHFTADAEAILRHAGAVTLD
ncbi:tRNA1(Val) (adenine(37)-N6)-methyltransferase [Fodinicurvata halophila]|uniref:tRNA1(Val) (Adenine(37)-N6)-methyltransferase n=1 Tax=Fodinicurvata halophila TaxID=1419723 RepID=A0ABV8UPU4_9PROT